MQTSRFPGFPIVRSSFTRHRKSIDRSRLNLNLSLCTTTTTPIWASLPTPPMSGTPPPEPSRNPPQLAGHRRKRSDSPPASTTSAVESLPAFVEHTVPRYGDQPSLQGRFVNPTMQIAPQTVPYLPPISYGAGPSIHRAQYSPPDASSNPPQVSPRTTRKTKAHVASACINCKKKHLRCDSGRPCRRCIQGGKEDTCRDVEHKKRGRPPLKPEDPTALGRPSRNVGAPSMGQFAGPSGITQTGESQGYAPLNYPPILPNVPPPLYGHSRTSSRTSLYGGLQSPYAQASVAPTPLNVTATGFSYQSRPQSISQMTSAQAQSSYMSHPGYAGQGPSRQMQPYMGYGYQQPEIPPSAQTLYHNPPFPRDQGTQPQQLEARYNPGLQLPPIRPSQQGLSESPISQQRSPLQQPSSYEQPPQQQSGERESKRPKMDIQGILGPKHD